MTQLFHDSAASSMAGVDGVAPVWIVDIFFWGACERSAGGGTSAWDLSILASSKYGALEIHSN